MGNDTNMYPNRTYDSVLLAVGTTLPDESYWQDAFSSAENAERRDMFGDFPSLFN
jgi:hypothetical protein